HFEAIEEERKNQNGVGVAHVTGVPVCGTDCELAGLDADLAILLDAAWRRLCLQNRGGWATARCALTCSRFAESLSRCAAARLMVVEPIWAEAGRLPHSPPEEHDPGEHSCGCEQFGDENDRLGSIRAVQAHPARGGGSVGAPHVKSSWGS